MFTLVADQETGKLLGAHIPADSAGEVIQAATLAVKFGLRVQDLVETFHPYLTMAEGAEAHGAHLQPRRRQALVLRGLSRV